MIVAAMRGLDWLLVSVVGSAARWEKELQNTKGRTNG